MLTGSLRKCVFVVDTITYCSMRFRGFHFYSASFKHAFSVLPLRPFTLFGNKRSSSSGLTYWHRPHTSSNKLPVLFLHGIGIGLYPYVNFLTDLRTQSDDTDDQVGIIAVEILPISFRVSRATQAKDEMCKNILAILEQHQIQDFVLVSHS